MRVSLESALAGSVTGFFVLLVINAFQIEFTVFTFSVALLAALNNIAFTFCSFKALDKINLSLFSMFSMLGGMVIPFLQGIVFYGEKLTLAKMLCLLLVGTALCLTVSRSKKKKGMLYNVGIFVLNGMSGVLSKIFTSASFEKTSNVGYSIWIAICTAAVSGVALFIISQKQLTPSPYRLKTFGIDAARGMGNQIANLLLVIALAHVDASVQFPMVTGGVMIVSTLLCFFGPRKPSKREIAAVILAFAGMLALFVMPI